MKDYNEDEFIMLSGIQHYKFCKRQWAIIHIENQWNENYRTVEGKIIHEKVHDMSIKEKRGNKIIVRAMPIHSRVMGISGECDMVEFIADENGVDIRSRGGKYRLYPVEYKRGTPKKDVEDISQLVAQVICLEEMFVTEIDEAYIYYAQTKRRLKVSITDEMRKDVCDTFKQMHNLILRKHTPKVKSSKACNACSLKNLCLPFAKKSAKEYIDKNISRGDES